MTASGHEPATSAPARAASAMARLVGDASVVVRSPGRVNLVGDHTDYNDGLALPMAIDRALGLAARANDDGVVRLWSELDEQLHTFELDEVAGKRWPDWTLYVQGVLALDPSGPPPTGFDLAVASDLPVGAGLSSSAALELGVARVLAALSGRAWDPAAAAALGQRAENDWVGVATGSMDQLTVAHATAGAALLIDCRSGTLSDVSVPAALDVLVLDTGARRTLVGSAYDDRRADCRRAAELLGVASLRDLDEDWDAAPSTATLPGRLRRRVRHVVTENARVRGVADAFARGEHEAAGAALTASHRSLRDDYEVSGPELDTMAEVARATPGVLGARMTGGGFAGACVALARAGEVDLEDLVARYRLSHDLPASAVALRPSDGTDVVLT